MTQVHFDGSDPLRLSDQLTQEERMVRDHVQNYAQRQLMPRVVHAFRHEALDREIFTEMGKLGLLGATLPIEFGGAGLNQVC